MRERSPFNFQAQIQQLYHRIKVTPQILKGQFPNQTEGFLDEARKEVYAMSKEQQSRVKMETTHASMFETKQCLLFAFCTANPIESKLTLQLIKKSTGKTSTKVLKKIDVQVNKLSFVLGQEDTIHLLAATKCGRLLVYKTFEEDNITVQSLRLSSNQLTCLLAPSIKNWVFVLNSAGAIYLVNFQQSRVYYEFRCSLPLIEDPKPRLIIDISEKFIGQVFGYGRIILWDISEEIRSTLNKKNSFEQAKVSNNSIDRRQISSKGQQKFKGKRFVLRSKMSIVSSLVNGITWCDFLGIFIMIIDHDGKLRILAINVNELNESHQFFTIISRYQICKEKDVGKNHEKEIIVDVKRLQQNNGIIVGKNMETTNCGKKISSQCFLEKYVFDSNFNVSKILVVSFFQIHQMDEFFLSSTAQYLMIRSKSEYNLVRNKVRRLS